MTNGAVELYYDNSKKLETTANGADCFNRFRVLGGTAPSFQMNSDAAGSNTATRAMFGLATGSNNFINGAVTNDVVLNTPHRFIVGHDTGEIMAVFDPDGEVQLRHDNSTKFETTSTGVTVTGTVTATSFSGDGSNLTGVTSVGGSTGVDFNDSVRIRLGTGNDLQLYHFNNESWIKNDTGTLNILNDGTTQIKNNADNEFLATFVSNGAVSLYYDNVKRFETTSTGIKCQTNILLNDGGELQFQNSVANRTATIRNNESSLEANLMFRTQNAGGGLDRWEMTKDGHWIPQANGSYDIGAQSYRVRNVYTSDLHMSNEGSSNDVDGTWGDWTIQEGESDLFLKNNRSGKKYKFNLTEVS
jgi:hypothetical protein